MTDRATELLAAYWTLAGDVWPGAPSEVSPFPLADRAAAAAAAGYTGMGFVHEDLAANAAAIGYGAMRRILGDRGIRHVEVEFLSDWDRDPGDPRRAASDRVFAELLEAAAELGARNLKVSPHLHVAPPPDVPRMRDAFARLCERARPAGANVIMELMPFTDVRTVATALEIVAGAEQPNGGLLLDAWHVFRGGIDLADVAAIPARFVKGVELDDAGPPEGDPFDDTRFRRRLPGDGAFDIPAFLDAVHRAGFDTPYYGVEIISETFRRLPLEVMARTSFEATMREVRRASAEPIETRR
ncbi:MAG TPA: sugar phosphate isomerase/epimerase [Candidatus Limnocylindrales bacterium]|nr:sugar phosphate isomerase/epimerase [Candidatus Limnocylindrales bacterium]